MTKPDLLIDLPFCGFYHSWLSNALDYALEMDVEYRAEQDTERAEGPRLEAHEIGEFAWECVDYSAAYQAMAADYPDALNVELEHRGLPAGFVFESMSSPKYYNFETDRVFAYVPRATVAAWLKAVRANGYADLDEIAHERHTSRDGFISHYRPAWRDWGAVSAWDHNQLCTLFLAAVKTEGLDTHDVENAAYMSICEQDYEYLDSAMDWREFDKRLDAARQRKIDELRADDPDYIPPYRCPETRDLFGAA